VKTTAFVSHYDCARHDTGWGHPDHQGRLPGVMRAVYRDMLTLFEPLLEIEGRHATVEELGRFHAEEYVGRVRAWRDEAEAQGKPIEVQPGLVISPATWDASAAAVGSGLTGVDAVREGRVRNAFCAVRPPGRDATPGSPGRFGCFNVLGVVAATLIADPATSVLVVEWGDPASARATLPRSDRLHFVAVPDADPSAGHPPGSGTEEPEASFAVRVRSMLDRELHDRSPDFILLSAGFDGLDEGPSRPPRLVPLDFHAATVAVREAAELHCGGRLVSILEGGYRDTALGTAIVQHLRALAGLPPAG
jgi:acetoin utilization deacetylase AcuC-like enzyme